jgi:hypothetical protein
MDMSMHTTRFDPSREEILAKLKCQSQPSIQGKLGVYTVGLPVVCTYCKLMAWLMVVFPFVLVNFFRITQWN